MRWRAVTESFEHVAEASGDHLGRNLQEFFENGFLQIRLVDTDRAAAKLDAIDHDIVMLSTHLFGIALQKRDVLSHRSSERMMAGVPAILLFIETEQGKIDDPKEIKAVWIDVQLAL